MESEHFHPPHHSNPNSQTTTSITPHLDFNPDLNPDLLEQQKQERIMEKLRDAVMKLASSDTNKPLTTERRNQIEQRLRESYPAFHTPSHPTYAWMIGRAIEELNAEGGSSKESISGYIKANYDDLPCAHASLLTHHLGKLCEKGEIVVTGEKCYMFPIVNPNCKKQELKSKRNRREKKSKGRGRAQKRAHKKNVVDDESLLLVKGIEEQNESQEQQSEVSKELSERLRPTGKVNEEGENVVNGGKCYKFLIGDPNRKKRGPKSKSSCEEKKSKGRRRSRKNKMIDDKSQANVKQNLPTGEQTEAVGEQNESHDQAGKQSSELVEGQTQVKELRSETEIQHGRRELVIKVGKKLGQQQQEENGVKLEPEEENKQVIEEQFQPREQIEVRSQMSQSFHVGKGGNSNGSNLRVQPSATSNPTVEGKRKESLEEIQHETKQIFEGSDIAVILALPEQTQKKTGICGKLEQLKLLPSSATAHYGLPLQPESPQLELTTLESKLCALQNVPKSQAMLTKHFVNSQQLEQEQQQQQKFQNSERPLEVKQREVEELFEERDQQTTFSDSTSQQQQQKFQNSERPLEVKRREVEELFEERDQQATFSDSTSQQETMPTSIDALMNSQYFEQEQQPYFLNSESLSQLGLRKVEQSSQVQQETREPEQLRQLTHQDHKTSEPVPAIASEIEILPREHHQESEPPNSERFPELKAEKTSQTTEKQAKRRGRKLSASQTIIMKSSPDLLLGLQQLKPEQQHEFQNQGNLKQRKLEGLSEPQEKQQQHPRQEMFGQRQLRSRGISPPKPEEAAAESLLSSQHELEQPLQQSRRQGLRRRSIPNPDADPTIRLQLLTNDQQHHEQPEPHLKPKPITAITMKALLPSHHHHQKPRLGRPPKPKQEARPPKPKQEAGKQGGKQGRPRKRMFPKRGIPLKTKPDAALIAGNILISQNQLEIPLSRGRGRPRKPKPDLDATTGTMLISQKEKLEQESKFQISERPLDVECIEVEELFEEQEQQLTICGSTSQQQILSSSLANFQHHEQEGRVHSPNSENPLELREAEQSQIQQEAQEHEHIPATVAISDVEMLLTQHHEQPDPPNSSRPRELKLMTEKACQTTEKQANRCGRKRSASHSSILTGSLGLHLERPKRSKVKGYSERLERLQHRHSWGQELLKLKKQNPNSRGQGRSLKPKTDSDTTGAKRGRGRPRKVE